MSDDSKSFRTTRFHKPGERAGYAITSHKEPVKAVDEAEEWLTAHGVTGESFVEIRFNSDREPHYRVFKLEGGMFGILNTGAALWPISYQEGYGRNLEFPPTWWEDTGQGPTQQQDGDEGKHKRDDDADSMEMGGSDDDEADDDEGEEEGEDEKEDREETEGDSDEDQDDEQQEEEPEMPRLKIFGKLRGPSGWRKRAESDTDNHRNNFEFKLGVLDEREYLPPRKRERDVRVHVKVSEHDDDRENVTLRITVPAGVDFNMPRDGVIEALIPIQPKI